MCGVAFNYITFPSEKKDVFMMHGKKLFAVLLPLVLTAVFAFLTIRHEGTSILDFIRYAAAFLITKQQYYEWRLDS